MSSIQRNAGTAGILTAVFFLILLAVTFRYDPAAFTDPVKALTFASEQRALKAVVGLVSILSSIALILFFAGLANRLADRTPTRAQATLYFGILGAAGLGIGSLLDWQGVAYLAGRVASDQTAAYHAWLALAAASTAIYGFAGALFGASTIAASWAVVSAGAMRRAIGWLGLLASLVLVVGTILPALVPESSFDSFYIAAGVLLLIWFAWTGIELRRA